MEKSLFPGISQDDTLDDLRKWGLKLVQPRCGYRFSVDSLLLAEFAHLPERGRVADLGTGSGVIALIVAKKMPAVEVVGIDLQGEMVERAKLSARINGLSHRVSFVRLNYRDVKDAFEPESFDYVIANPPYWEPDRGRMVKDRGKALARYELEATLEDLVEAAFYLLRFRGKFGLIFCAERSVDVLSSLRARGLEPKRLRFVHPYSRRKAQFVMVEAVKGAKRGALEVEPPLIIYEKDGRYTDEVAEMIGVVR